MGSQMGGVVGRAVTARAARRGANGGLQRVGRGEVQLL